MAVPHIPPSGRFTLDLTALGLALAAFFEKFAPVAATVASLAATTWIVIQAYYFIKEKRKGKK